MEPFPIPEQKKRTRKAGIGFGDGGKVLLIVAPAATMHEFAEIFKALGAQNAPNLDGGGTAALWFGGYKVGPGRALPNAIVFK